MLYSELIPDNLGIIFRKEFTDLRDSTVKDFERYTGLIVDSQRNVRVGSSTIMFRHIEELNNIQNINLGWAAIEQGDELETDNEFFLLFGRLRRSLTPSNEFNEFGLPLHTLFVIGNAGDHWGRALWKEGKLDDASLSEANTYDNADVLAPDFLESLEILRKNKPAIYDQFVMNSWDIKQSEYVMIKAHHLNALKNIPMKYEATRRIVSCDPSLGGDECVIYGIENGEIIRTEIMHENDETKIAAKIAEVGVDIEAYDFVVDAIGIGHGVATFLTKLVKDQGKAVTFLGSKDDAFEGKRFVDRRSEMWDYVAQQVIDKKLHFPEDSELRRQLSAVKYEPIMRKGRFRIEEKQKTKKTLGCSPDRADAFVYGIYHLQFVDENRYRRKIKDRYRLETPRAESSLGIVNF